jgi:hypothetical protein
MATEVCEVEEKAVDEPKGDLEKRPQAGRGSF